jgi:hypothetical protein
MSKPSPVPVAIVCSECELPWDDHGAKPTLEDCIRLLKVERSKPSPNWYWWQSPFYGSGASQFTSTVREYRSPSTS